jgi:Mrp family chromosome partitioning ATPase
MALERRTKRPANEQSERELADRALKEQMERIRHKILVLSGQDGVGKSTVAAHIATSLARAGEKVGLLDVDAPPADPSASTRAVGPAVEVGR